MENIIKSAGNDRGKLVPVSMLIVNWNSGALLVECLQHLMAQTVHPVQVLIVDNASSDASVDAVGDLENVSVRRVDINLGFAAGNNLAIAECDSEYIALLNPDAFPEPEWLENLLAAASSTPDVGAFGSRQLQQTKTSRFTSLRPLAWVHISQENIVSTGY